MRNRLLPLSLAVFAAACVTINVPELPEEGSSRGPISISADPFNQLIAQIDDRFSDSSFAHAHWGVLIQSLDNGRVWYQRNADRLFMPASNEKIPTTAAALLSLGPDFQFETALCHRGTVTDGTLDGDLVVFGNGDPTLYTRFLDDPRDVFRGWANDLKSQGITHVTGDVIGDDDAFDDEHIGYGWSLDSLAHWYAAEIGALQLNENYVDVRIVPPDTVEGEVELIPNLPSAHFTLVNEIEVVRRGRNRVRFDRAFGTNEIRFTGTVVAGSNAFERSPAITNPTRFYVTVLKEVLEEEGIEIDGEPVDCDDLEEWEHQAEDFPRLATHLSPPLSEIATGLMKRSQNLYAETMVRAMGWQTAGIGSFDAGREEVEEQLAGLGIEPGSHAFLDGSGLTRYNYISPRQIVDILRGMRESRHWEVWRDTLPIAGVDGTIRSRMRGTPAENNVRAKTGTISNVRALSGYVTTADGENLVFSMIVNGYLLPTRAAERIQDDALVMLASFDRRH
jgi:D-alanyl-D-alanine carboxypeptidase/D-alanyl-D-alanine-endopeptidase (penicillin-binding protein 4)